MSNVINSSRKSNNAKTGIVSDPLYKEHLTGIGHPECPERFDSIIDAVSALPHKTLEPQDAAVEDILRCHTSEYHNKVVAECSNLEGISTLSTGDTPICEATYRVAMRAAGGILRAVDAVMTGEAQNAFCIVRPPGHHACSDVGMGFCVFNNVAIGARYAQSKYNVEKVLIVDWDVHHGNGTQEIFYRDPTVFYFSTHQSPLYPGTGSTTETGSGEGLGSTLNCPILPGERSRDDIINAFSTQLVPAMHRFQPHLVMISAGFDGHRDDPLGGFDLTEEDFAELTRIVKEIANQYAGGRIVSVLEGGYNLRAIAAAAKAHVKAFMSR